MVLPLGIFALTLALVILRPRGLSVGAGALIGAALALGLVGWNDVRAVWNDTLTLVAFGLESVLRTSG